MISEKNKQLVAAALLLLTPPGLQCTKHQIRRASKHIHAAILALSVESRKEELKRRRLARLKPGELLNSINGRNAIEKRWEQYQCSIMNNEEFRKLSAPWEASELAELLGVSAWQINAYRRKKQTRRVPDDVAKKLLELVNKSMQEELNMCLPGMEDYIAEKEENNNEQ